MELTHVYDTFISTPTGAVVSRLSREYGINIMGLNLEVNYIPTYLEDDSSSWKAYCCTISGNHDIEFHFIINTETQKLVELEVVDFSGIEVA